MTLEDLQHIFKDQLSVPNVTAQKLYFMLLDGEHRVIERHPAADIEALLPMLDSFQYSGSQGGMPRFSKS